MAEKIDKTNVVRTLDQKKIPYDYFSYEVDQAISGVDCAHKLGIPEELVFKTLVTVGASKTNYVFVIPVAEELDLKKAAKASGEKNIMLVKSADLLGLTGYIHGGCSPIGMKKQFKTFLHESADSIEKITFSAGKIGRQVRISVDDLKKAVPLTTVDLIKEQ